MPVNRSLFTETPNNIDTMIARRAPYSMSLRSKSAYKYLICF